MMTGKRKIGVFKVSSTDNELSPEITFNESLKFLSWVWRHSKSELLWLILAMITAVGVSSLSAISLLYASKFIDAVSIKYEALKMIKLGSIIVAVFLGSSILKLITVALEALAVTNIRQNFEVACFRHLSYLPYEYLEGHSHGQITGALMSEVPMATNLVGIILRSFIRAPVAIAVVAGVLWYNSPLIAVVVIISMPLLFIGLRSFSTLVTKSSYHTFENVSKMYSKMIERLAGVRIIRCLGITTQYADEMSGLSEKIAWESRRSAVFGSLQQSLQELISVVILIGFLWWLALKVINGTMQIGQALLVPAAILYIRDESLWVSHGFMQFWKTMSAVARLSELLTVKREEIGAQKLSETVNRIRLVNVGFQYPDGEKILEHVNLELTCGGLTVIVGESGAGKSTLCDLCLRLRAPTEGKILYNNIELSDIDEDSLRNCTALVEQEPYLFEGSIRHNLLFAKPDATDEDIWEALRLANAYHFVKGLQGGLDHDVGQNGVNLSVGQKQRIAISRVLLRKPQFLVLDEVTSNLDMANEAEILQTILELSRHTIILCTTHRPSIIRNACEVYCISNKRLQRINVYREVNDEDSGVKVSVHSDSISKEKTNTNN